MRRHGYGVAAALLIFAGGCNGSSGKAAPPPLATFQAAEVVIGQPDFASAAPDRGAAISAAGVHFPTGAAGYDAGALIVPDTFNHRLLRYQTLPKASGAAADAVLGQAGPTEGAPSHEVGRFHFPHGAWVGASGLLVADAGASRAVLAADGGVRLLGWDPQAPAYRWGCAADRLSEPWRAIEVSGKVIVADRANHRVLIWTSPPEAGRPADLVLGQRDLAHCAANDIVGQGASGGRSAATLSSPTDVWSDGTRLLVADQGNHRVLLWNTFPTRSGAPADVVLGQPDFKVGTPQTTRAGMSAPAAVASDKQVILVADMRNNRVLRWAAFPAANGAPADQVLGQGDFLHGAANDDDQDGVSGPATARTLSAPTGVAIAGDDVVVTDTYNHRLLLFRGR